MGGARYAMTERKPGNARRFVFKKPLGVNLPCGPLHCSPSLMIKGVVLWNASSSNSPATGWIA